MQNWPERVVLSGFMATGKSCVGRELARLLAYAFVDTDERIAQSEGRSIAQVWQDSGEEYFRQRESELAAELSCAHHTVIATGGGMLLSAANRALLGGPVICLHADSEVLIERIRAQQERPLMFTEQIEQRIETLLAERDSVYLSFEHHVDTTRTSPAQAAREAAVQLGLLPPTVVLADAGPVYPVVIRRGLLADPAPWTQHAAAASRIFVISNDTVFPLHGAKLLGALGATGLDIEVLTVPDGERYKNLDTARQLIDELALRAADRNCLVLALGGGVVGDLAAFVASIYMRGLRLIQLPTTLLAQLDAAIGGKTAVDHSAAKNLIGSFHHPQVVLADPEVLTTLPAAELSNGLAEALKTALIGNAALFELLEREAPRALACELELLEEITRECAEIKADIVSADPEDHGARRMLNLGHTVGHALEAAGGYTAPSHGQAVGLGLIAATWIATELGLAEAVLLERVKSAVGRCGLPISTPLARQSSVLEHLRLDKKSSAGKLTMLLPVRPGEVIVSTDVDAALLTRALQVISP